MAYGSSLSLVAMNLDFRNDTGVVQKLTQFVQRPQSIIIHSKFGFIHKFGLNATVVQIIDSNKRSQYIQLVYRST